MRLTSNKGIHWEYRVFGELSTEHRRFIVGLCSEFIEEKNVTDHYLWRTGIRANIKLRKKKLKFKRFLRGTEDGFEQWDEGKHLRYKFPLGPSTIALLESYLDAKAPPVIRSGCDNEEQLKDALSLFEPSVRLVTIQKRRFKYAYLYNGIPLLLEIADILSPIKVTSVCIESNHFTNGDLGHGLRDMRGARDSLELSDSLRIMDYVHFLGELALKGLLEMHPNSDNRGQNDSRITAEIRGARMHQLSIYTIFDGKQVLLDDVLRDYNTLRDNRTVYASDFERDAIESARREEDLKAY